MSSEGSGIVVTTLEGREQVKFLLVHFILEEVKGKEKDQGVTFPKMSYEMCTNS